MKIAILGTRGIPARYGGFETLAEQLSARLAARGHEVTVYWRRPFTEAEVVFICNVANGPIAWIPRLVGKPTALNVDGLDRKRKKWNLIGRSSLYMCELFSAFTPTR